MVEISQPALREATVAMERSLSQALGIKPSGSIRHVAERTIRTYLQVRADNTRMNRMKAETISIMYLEVGEWCEIFASCKQNVHGQMKSIRRRLGAPDRKWRITQVKPFTWRVMRMPDSAFNLNKPAVWNSKAVFLAEIPLGESRVWPGAYKAFQITACHHKNKAREVAGDTNANWATKRVEGGMEVTRTR